MPTAIRPEPPQARRIRLDLPAPVADALSRLAHSEDRPADRQAVRLLREGLERAGTLTPDSADEEPER